MSDPTTFAECPPRGLGAFLLLLPSGPLLLNILSKNDDESHPEREGVASITNHYCYYCYERLLLLLLLLPRKSSSKTLWVIKHPHTLTQETPRTEKRAFLPTLTHLFGIAHVHWPEVTSSVQTSFNRSFGPEKPPMTTIVSSPIKEAEWRNRGLGPSPDVSTLDH